jgi:hypothetical protein
MDALGRKEFFPPACTPGNAVPKGWFWCNGRPALERFADWSNATSKPSFALHVDVEIQRKSKNLYTFGNRDKPYRIFFA